MGSSLYSGDAEEIHNGADDNASGTAVVMELACLLRKNPYPNYNYLLMGFSGEEEGLLGSGYFAKHPTLPLNTVSYMLNLDMVGRLDTTKRELGINGTGTSPTWDTVLNKVLPDRFAIKTTESGMGSSDHTSFYLQDIPALHFFTGVHTDYHKPSDDADKVNYEGMADVTLYLYELIKKLDTHPKMVFAKTQDTTERLPQLKVTLGVMPDYFYDKAGLRIEGVSKAKPAEKAGLQAGDIILTLGEYEVGDIRDYMRALSHFEKGQTIVLKIKRGEVIIDTDLTF